MLIPYVLYEGSRMVSHLSESAFLTLEAASCWDVTEQGMSLLFHLFGSSILAHTPLLMSGGTIPDNNSR